MGHLKVGCIQESPGLALVWGHADRAAGNARGLGRVNLHECHASTSLVGLLDLSQSYLGVGGD